MQNSTVEKSFHAKFRSSKIKFLVNYNRQKVISYKILIVKKSYFAQFRSSKSKFDEIEIWQFEGFSTFDFLSLQLPLLKTFVFLHCPIWHKLEFQRGFHWHVKARMIGKWWVVGKNKSWWCWHLFFDLLKIKSGGENKMGLLSQPYWNRQEG